MAIDPGTMQQMLMARLAQGPQGGAQGGGGGPQMQGQIDPQNAASSMVQKAMLMRALQAPQIQQRQAQGMLPGTNAMMAQAPAVPPPQLPVPQMPANPAIAAPFAQPTPGYS